jgi:hypothetical protein
LLTSVGANLLSARAGQQRDGVGQRGHLRLSTHAAFSLRAITSWISQPLYIIPSMT